MRLDFLSVIRGFLLGIGVSLLLFATAPLQAQQQATPVPAGTVVSEFSNAAQTIGVVGVVAIVAVLILLVAVGALFMGVYRLGTPLINNIAAANLRADSAAAELIRTTEANRVAEALKVQIQAQAAESQERTANILATLETKGEAKTNLESATEAINNHTTATFTDAKQQLEQAATHIDQAAKTIGDVVTKADLKQELDPIRDELHGIADTLRKKRDTGDLRPSADPPLTEP